MSKKHKRHKHGFCDKHGNEYRIKITFPLLRFVRDELDIDLGKNESYIALSNNPIDLVNVLYCLVKEQADAYGLTDVQFGEAFVNRDELDKAWAAFGKAFLSFCPSHQADLLRQLMATAEKTELLSQIEAENRLKSLVESYNLDSKLLEALESSQATIPLEN